MICAFKDYVCSIVCAVCIYWYFDINTAILVKNYCESFRKKEA